MYTPICDTCNISKDNNKIRVENLRVKTEGVKILHEFVDK